MPQLEPSYLLPFISASCSAHWTKFYTCVRNIRGRTPFQLINSGMTGLLPDKIQRRPGDGEGRSVSLLNCSVNEHLLVYSNKFKHTLITSVPVLNLN
jgi:hypothetical protein